MKKIKNFMFSKCLAAKDAYNDFVNGERGEVNVIAIILILAIAIALIIIFKDQIGNMVDRIFGKANEDLEQIIG